MGEFIVTYLGVGFIFYLFVHGILEHEEWKKSHRILFNLSLVFGWIFYVMCFIVTISIAAAETINEFIEIKSK